MTRSSKHVTRQADAAADQLLAWLRQRREAVAGDKRVPGETAGRTLVDGSSESSPITAAPVAIEMAAKVPRDPADAASVGAPLRLPHTDWLHHDLSVTGPTPAMAAFQAAACGAGVIPWQLDPDRLQEDFFHLLVAPSPPQWRRLSLAGARVLAGQLREAVAARHGAATARVGHSRACPFDLHALSPVPDTMLRLGPDHPNALAWLWTHWGTTEALRHVAVAPALALRVPLPSNVTTLRLSFWSADWTPWRALAGIAARWPSLRFDISPSYGTP